jgi:multiple sugar transport system substrate-binding protein
LCIALIAVLALVLAACGGGGGGNESSGPTEIQVWHGYQDTEGDAFKGLVAQYNKENPNVKVSELYSSNDLVLQKVLTAVRGNSAPDVAYMFGSWAPNIAKISSLVDMTEEVAKPDWKWDDFYEAERKAATVGDKVIGVPALVDNLAIVYNKKLFEEAGVEPPTPNWTWDDFRAAAQKLTDPAKGQYGWLIPADGSEDTVWHWLPMLWEAGGNILNADNTKAEFNSDAGVKAVETILALKKNAPEGVAGWGWGENRAAWLGGQLATNISWQDSGTQATRPDQSKIVGDVLTIYEPRVEGGRFAPPNIAGSTSVVTATSKNVEGAFLMLAFLTSASIMAMNEANANGVAPGYRSVLANPNLRKVSQPAEVWASELDYAWCAPRLPGMFEMEQALGNEINKAVVGQASPKEALDAGVKAWREIMDKNGFYSGTPPIDFAAVVDATWIGKGKTPPV